MLTDFSPGHAETWDALERLSRLADAAAAGKATQKAEVALMALRNRLHLFGARPP